MALKQDKQAIGRRVRLNEGVDGVRTDWFKQQPEQRRAGLEEKAIGGMSSVA